MTNYEFVIDPEYRSDLSFEEAIAKEPGVMFRAQDGTFCMVASHKWREPHCLVLFSPNPAVITSSSAGYVRFRELVPSRLSVTPIKEY